VGQRVEATEVEMEVEAEAGGAAAIINPQVVVQETVDT